MGRDVVRAVSKVYDNGLGPVGVRGRLSIVGEHRGDGGAARLRAAPPCSLTPAGMGGRRGVVHRASHPFPAPLGPSP